MAAIEGADKSLPDGLHDSAQPGGFLRGGEPLNLVVEQYERVDGHLVRVCGLLQSVEVGVTIGVVHKHGRKPMPALHDKVHLPGHRQTRQARHRS